MKNFYGLLLIVFFTIHLFGQSKQVIVEAVDSRFPVVNKDTPGNVNGPAWEEVGAWVNGFARVSSGHKWGFIDRSGNPVIKAVYEATRNFTNHLAAVKQNAKWGFINEKGAIVIPFEYDIVYDFKEPVTAVYKNSKWFLMNEQGNVIKTLDADVFWGFNKGLARFTRKGRSGIMNNKGEIISLEPEKPALSKKINSPALRAHSAESGACPANIDFENGDFTNWTCYIGSVAAVGTTNVVTVTPSPPTPNRHVIIPNTNPSAIDPYGLFPINPPDGSGYAVKLGNDINGAQAERISYQINVPANSNDASITYRYAVVFQDPGHLTYEQPRFSAKLLDVATNTYLPCATYEYISTSSLPGFNSSPIDDTVKYKTWASVYVNLSHYAGKSLILEFTTADCTRGLHWGYAYVDVGDCNITASVQYQCNPNQAVFTAPPGFQYYNWYTNNFGTLLGTGETMTMTSPPAPGTTIHVEVIPYNGFGCSDTLEVPFTVGFPVANAGPDKSLCIGTPTSIGSNTVTGYSYSWAPAYFLSNPHIASPLANPPADTTYIVTVTNNASGCTAQDTVTVHV
ncbi:MAG: WG repeat-containing protein, partial [Bacteroidota bacterium]|nr:WG repeat-containing protein [Bacteroidota bacterium]